MRTDSSNRLYKLKRIPPRGNAAGENDGRSDYNTGLQRAGRRTNRRSSCNSPTPAARSSTAFCAYRESVADVPQVVKYRTSTMQPSSIPQVLIKLYGQPDGDEQSSLLFAGDFFIRPDHPLHGGNNLFDPAIVQLIRESSFPIVNFEGTLNQQGNGGIPKEGPRLALHAGAPAVLSSAGFRAVTLANNHAMDYGAEGLADTIRVSTESGLQHVGAGRNLQGAMEPIRLCLPGDVRLQILSFCEREFGVSTGEAPGTAWLTSPQTENAIQRAKQESDVVIVCSHGGNEFMPLPSPQRRRQLQNLIDAGANLVIGHHPHVPQGWEPYKDSYIFYSLGDFYFDSLDGNRYDCRDWGFMVRVGIAEGRIKSLKILPYERVSDKIVPLGQRRNAATCLAFLEKISSILTAPNFEGYWQHLAMDRLSDYRPFLRQTRTQSRAPLREWARERLQMGRDMWRSWFPAKGDSPERHTTPFQQRALGTLNVIRCESHRWALETALAVLAGERKDLRTDEIRKELETMRPLYTYESA